MSYVDHNFHIRKIAKCILKNVSMKLEVDLIVNGLQQKTEDMIDSFYLYDLSEKKTVKRPQKSALDTFV